MKKSDLKYGNVVETRNGHKLLLNEIYGEPILIFLNCKGFTLLNSFDIELKDGFNVKSGDIMKVYKDYTCKELLWERKEPKEKPKLTEDEKDPCTFSGSVTCDLNLLKAILKKKVNIFDVWRLDTYEEYQKQYRFASYHAEKDILTKSEFKLLKEVLEDE